MSELFAKAMQGIEEKVAMQEIRKVIRGKDPDYLKLDAIIGIVHAFEEEFELAGKILEEREMKAEEEEMRKQRSEEMFEAMTEPLNKLTIHKTKD